MRPLVMGFGELLWDELPGGRRLGGAPANFACHASRLGCRGAVASRVGLDALGREALATLDALGVDRGQVETHPSLPTGTVTVAVDAQGHPSYRIQEPTAWDALEATTSLLAMAAQAQAICFGTLASRGPRSAQALGQVLKAAAPGCLKVFDVNLRQAYFTPELIRTLLGHSDLLKLNEDELPVVAAACGVAPEPEALRSRFGLRLVALTLGSKGSVLCTATDRLEEPGRPVRVVDTLGAGDAFTAALVAGLVLGDPLALAHRHAAELSAEVCTRAGAF